VGLREEEDGKGVAADEQEDCRPTKKPKISKERSAQQYPVGGLRAPEQEQQEDEERAGWRGGRRMYDEQTSTQGQQAKVHARLSPGRAQGWLG
jgi:hypothetical protein